MNKQIGSIFLLAGTAIGSGMISIPIVLAKCGVILSIFIMIFFCWLTYMTAIIRTDLNSEADFSLQDVGEKFSGKIAGAIGGFSLRILLYALLSAYVFGCSSIIHSLSKGMFELTNIICVLSIFILLTFILLSNKQIISLNNIMFTAKLSSFAALMIGLTFNVEFYQPILIPIETSFHGSWNAILPIVFTSFGFQGSLHSLTKFVNNDRVIIKRACFWGSIIPGIVYIAWTLCVLLIVFNTDLDFFEKMKRDQILVGDLISVLSNVSKIKSIQLTVWIISILSISTSVIGVGLALVDDLSKFLKNRLFKNKKLKDFAIILIAFVPSTIVALIVPNAFIKVLNFAGIILSIIAIILPILLFLKMGKTSVRSIKNKLTIALIFLFGILIIVTGVLDML